MSIRLTTVIITISVATVTLLCLAPTLRRLTRDTHHNMAQNRRHKKGQNRALRVLVDMDGVLCDFEGHFLQRYREAFPGAPYVPLEERRSFYLGDQYKAFGNDAVAHTRTITEAKGFFREMPPIPNAVDALKEMSSMENVEIFICTSPMTWALHSAVEKLEWVEKHLGRDWCSRVIITKDKTVIAGDLLIDDKHKIKGLEKLPSWDHVLFSACHNKHLDLSRLQIKHRLDSWENQEQWMQLIQDYLKKIS